MKRELILFYHPNKKFFIKTEDIKKFKKSYSKIILFKYSKEFYSFNNNFNNFKLNNIKNNYKNLGIYLDIKKIYEINFFLKNITTNSKNKKIFVSPYFISNLILEDEIIFYELSKIYKIKFFRSELSLIKNRYILAENIFKQPYNLKKKTYFTNKDYNLFKTNYISSMQKFSEQSKSKTIYKPFYIMLVNILSFIISIRFNKKPKEYILVILNNNRILNSLSEIINLKYFINLAMNKFKYEIVFLIHPNSNPLYFFLKAIKNKNFFFQNKKILFIHKPKNLIDIIQNSKFIIHLTSSLSAQALLFDKKILCLGKKNIYIKNLKNVVSNIRKSNLNFLKKKMNSTDISRKNQFLINYLSNTVNDKGTFKLFTKKENYSSNSRTKNINKNDKKIIQNLLNAI